MHPTRRPSCRMARSMDSPSPSTQKRRLFSRTALGMTGMHESTSTYASEQPDWTRLTSTPPFGPVIPFSHADSYRIEERVHLVQDCDAIRIAGSPDFEAAHAQSRDSVE